MMAQQTSNNVVVVQQPGAPVSLCVCVCVYVCVCVCMCVCVCVHM